MTLFGLDREMLGPLAVVAAILIVRVLFFPARMVRWFVPRRGPKRSWREWTWAERVLVGAGAALLAAVWVHRIRDLGTGLMLVGLVLLVFGIKGLRALRSRPR